MTLQLFTFLKKGIIESNWKTYLLLITVWLGIIVFLPGGMFKYMYLSIAAVGLFLIVYFLLLHIEWGIYAFAFLIPFQLYIFQDSVLSLTSVFLKILFILTVLRVLMHRIDVPHSSINIPLMLFLLIFSVASINLYNIEFSFFHEFIKWIGYLTIFYVILINIREKRQAKLLVYALLMSSISSSIIGVYFYFKGPGFASYFAGTYLGHLIQGYREYLLSANPNLFSQAFYGTFASYNYYAAFTSVALCLSLGKSFFNKGKDKILYFSIFIFLFISMLFSVSRGALIGMAASILAMTALYKKNIKFYWFSSVIFTLVFAIAFLYPDFFLQAIEKSVGYQRWSVEALQRAQATRFYIYEGAWQTFLNHPIIGYGAQIGWPHNWYLDILNKTGVLGMLIWVYVFYQLLKRNLIILRNQKDNFLKSMSLAMVGIYVYFFTHGLFSLFMNHKKNAMILWLCFGLAMANLSLGRSESPKRCWTKSVFIDSIPLAPILFVVILGIGTMFLLLKLSFQEAYFVFALMALILFTVLSKIQNTGSETKTFQMPERER